ncbi:magnesium chelatase subunit ChlI family protein [Virgibacillus sp. FSP13]
MLPAIIAARKKGFKIIYLHPIDHTPLNHIDGIEFRRLLTYTRLNEEQERMMRQWSSKHNWSTRVQVKILRLARTISDLSGEDEITNESIWEAITISCYQIRKQQRGMVK